MQFLSLSPQHPTPKGWECYEEAANLGGENKKQKVICRAEQKHGQTPLHRLLLLY